MRLLRDAQYIRTPPVITTTFSNTCFRDSHVNLLIVRPLRKDLHKHPPPPDALPIIPQSNLPVKHFTLLISLNTVSDTALQYGVWKFTRSQHESFADHFAHAIDRHAGSWASNRKSRSQMIDIVLAQSPQENVADTMWLHLTDPLLMAGSGSE